MNKLAKVIFIFVFFTTTARATLIEYQFDTLVFENDQSVTGEFVFDTATNELNDLSILLYGPALTIEFGLGDLTSPDAFSVSFDNNVFGDADSEGFQLFKDDITLVTGLYGLGAEDTCYENSSFDQFCNAGLFSFSPTSTVAQSISAPVPLLLIFLGLILGHIVRHRSN